MLTGEEREGTIVEHLEELRWVIIRSLLSLLIFIPVVFYFSDRILEFIVVHFCPNSMKLRFFSPIEPLIIKLKLSLYFSLFISLPYISKQIWSFISPALSGKTKTFSIGFVFFSWLLFILGGCFATYLIMPTVMNFSFSFQTTYLEAAIGISQFVNLLVMLVIGFGLMFQFPIAILLFVKAGIVSISKLKSLRSVIIIFIFVISALLTPPDFVSQLLMGIPTYLLFEIGLLIASLSVKSDNKSTED